MHQAIWRDSALLLIGHGSTKNSNSRAATLLQAEFLRQRNLFAQVEAAFWQQSPSLPEVFGAIASHQVFIIPLFLSKGYFTETAIPESLGLKAKHQTSFPRCTRLGHARCYYGHPVGTHFKITDLLLHRAQQVVQQNFTKSPSIAAESTALFLAGHGTPRDRNSREALETHARRIRSLNRYETVQTIYLEEEPRIEKCYQLSQSPQIIVVPFFLSNGLHVQEDIPILLGASADQVKARLAEGQDTWNNPTRINDRWVWYAPGLGTDPLLTDIILERVKEIFLENSRS